MNVFNRTTYVWRVPGRTRTLTNTAVPKGTRKKVHMNSRDLPPGFHQADGFIYYVIDSICTRWQDYVNHPYNKKRLQKLFEDGKRIVLIHEQSHFLDRVPELPHYSLETIPYKEHIIVFRLLGYTDRKYPKTWNEVLNLAIRSMNEYRITYNEILRNISVCKVVSMKVHAAPITFQSMNIANGWEVFLRVYRANTEKTFYNLFATNHGKNITKPILFDRGIIERQGKNPEFYFAKKTIDEIEGDEEMPTYITFQALPVEKKPLSMLTLENVLQEKVLKPEPVGREPIIA